MLILCAVLAQIEADEVEPDTEAAELDRLHKKLTADAAALVNDDPEAVDQLWEVAIDWLHNPESKSDDK